MSDETNPFLVAEGFTSSPPETEPKEKFNPFAAPIIDPDPSRSEQLVKHDEASSAPARPTRPDGTYYSSDAKERMAQLQADGKMTPAAGYLAAPAKRKKAKRAAEVLAEMASENAEKIKQVFLDGIDKSQPISVRLQAAKQILDNENNEEALSMAREKQEFEAMSHADLRDDIVGMLTSLHRAGQIADDVLGSADELPEVDLVDE